MKPTGRAPGTGAGGTGALHLWRGHCIPSLHPQHASLSYLSGDDGVIVYALRSYGQHWMKRPRGGDLQGGKAEGEGEA